MKFNILILLFTLLLSSNAFSGKIGIEAGSGTKSNYGLLGMGVRYFPTKNFDLYYSGGVDLIGATSIVGARIYTNPMGNKCFFFITCTPLYYIGIHTGRTNGGIVTSEENNIESEYDFTSSSFSGVNIGSFDLFGGWFYYSLDISYRSYSKAPEYMLISGPVNDESEESFKSLIENGFGIALSLGVLF